jgi:hypothetical protein
MIMTMMMMIMVMMMTARRGPRWLWAGRRRGASDGGVAATGHSIDPHALTGIMMMIMMI